MDEIEKLMCLAVGFAVVTTLIAYVALAVLVIHSFLTTGLSWEFAYGVVVLFIGSCCFWRIWKIYTRYFK